MHECNFRWWECCWSQANPTNNKRKEAKVVCNGRSVTERTNRKARPPQTPAHTHVSREDRKEMQGNGFGKGRTKRRDTILASTTMQQNRKQINVAYATHIRKVCTANLPHVRNVAARSNAFATSRASGAGGEWCWCLPVQITAQRSVTVEKRFLHYYKPIGSACVAIFIGRTIFGDTGGPMA